MANVSKSEKLLLSYPNFLADVGAEAGSDGAGTDLSANQNDDLTFRVTSNQDCRIEAIVVNFPASVGVVVEAFLGYGIDKLITPIPTLGVSHQIIDPADVAAAVTAGNGYLAVGSGRVLQREGKGELTVVVRGAVNGFKRIMVLATPLRGS